MDPIVLAQFCGEGVSLADHIQNAEFFKAGACQFIDPIGLALVAMIVYGAVAIPIQLRTDSVMIPVVLLLLTGGATMTTIAGPATSIATVVLLMVGPGVITLALYVYSR